jgi:hypothetical protein
VLIDCSDLRLEVEEFNKKQWHSLSSESWSAQCNSLCVSILLGNALD